METRPRKIGNYPARRLEGIVERLILHRWREELFGDLCESSLFLSPSRYFLRAADLASFAVVSEVRHALRTSPIFEPNRMGLVIAILGYFASLYKNPDPAPTNVVDFLLGMLSSAAIAYWVLCPAGRSIWMSALFVVLLSVQLCLVLLNAFPGYLPANLTFGRWGISITLLAVSAGAIERWLSASEKRG